uniref:ABC transporter domain-containing protein n=1 Tax=Oncorhynchus mykiss TaxID=8022 RepID=A0A8K9WN91_ONCMY
MFISDGLFQRHHETRDERHHGANRKWKNIVSHIHTHPLFLLSSPLLSSPLLSSPLLSSPLLSSSLLFSSPHPLFSSSPLLFSSPPLLLSSLLLILSSLLLSSPLLSSPLFSSLHPLLSSLPSLLDVIAGRKDPAGLKFGQVLIDGKMVDSDLRLISAYVVQDDILMGTLSVRENLLFSVNLRLDPRHYSAADKQQRVDSIIDDLGLQDCAHTKIGTEFLRGVSGGERKRCSIGMELITSPRLLFLDEPTTGLDSNTANHIINLLHRLSRSGKTIVFSIHQPRYSIFSRFDHLTLMHRGELVYAGAAGKALSYFTDLGKTWREERELGREGGRRGREESWCTLELPGRMGAFFFLIINMVFGNLSAVELFINERALFIHENSSGYYRTSVYFLSKIFADLIPNRIVPILIFSAIAYYMMGLKPAFTAFLLFTLTMSLVSLAGVSLAFLVSASVSSFAMANVLIALPFVFMMVFGGFLVNLNSMLSWLSWLKWISIFRYGLEAVTINEFKGQIFYSNTTILPGEVYLETQGIDYSTWGFWQNHVALAGIITVCMVLAYIQLRRINRWK